MVPFLVAGTVGLVLAVLALLPARPRATKANFDRTEIGMTRLEVEAILGPPGTWGVLRPGRAAWDSAVNDDFAFIDFDENGKVKSKQWRELPDERTVWQKLLDRSF